MNAKDRKRAATIRSQLADMSRDGWRNARPCDYQPLERELRQLEGYSEPEIERSQARIKSLFDAAGVNLDDDIIEDKPPARSSIFDSHRCWKCDDGKKPCPYGGPHRCEYPRALND